jgi:hypothetical protein
MAELAASAVDFETELAASAVDFEPELAAGAVDDEPELAAGAVDDELEPAVAVAVAAAVRCLEFYSGLGGWHMALEACRESLVRRGAGGTGPAARLARGGAVVVGAFELSPIANQAYTARPPAAPGGPSASAWGAEGAGARWLRARGRGG